MSIQLLFHIMALIQTATLISFWLIFGVLTPPSTISQLYRDSQFYWWAKPEYPEKTTELPQNEINVAVWIRAMIWNSSWIDIYLCNQCLSSLTIRVPTHVEVYLTQHYVRQVVTNGGGSRGTRRESPTMVKQLVNFITCGCESSAPFL
jgi:hypothetical protein